MLRDRKLLALAIASLFVRIAFIAFHPLNSDEPQHLHVAWGWSRGLVQYRDLFDNHFPLLHLLFAPLMRLMPKGAGICAALCLLASVKALPLFLAHALAFASARQPLDWKRVACGFAIPLAIAAIAFQWLGAFDAMLYATLFYNVSLPVHAMRRIGGAISFGVLAPVLALRVPERWRNAHLAFFALWYPIILLCFWPSITPRDFLPLAPLVALAIGELAPVITFVTATLASIAFAQPWKPAETNRAHVVDAAVALTTKDDLIYDLKGETIFRRRPIFGIYDIVGRALTGNGTLHGPLRVCGTDVRDGAFLIAVPQVYAVVAREPSRVAIDGVPYAGPRFLDAGRHTLTSTEHNVRVVWWRAVEQNR